MPQEGMTIDVPDEDIRDTNEAPRPKSSGQQHVNTAGFEDLRAQLSDVTKRADEEKRRADEAETRRQNAEAQGRRDRDDAVKARQDARAARTEGAEGRKIAITNAITTQKTLLDSLESEYAAAFEAGDSKKIANLQRRMSESASELKQLEAGVTAIGADDDEPRGRATEGRVERDEPPPRKQPQTEDEKFEAYVSQFSPRAQTWLRKHPEAVTNQSKNFGLLAAHNEARSMGYEADSDAYYAHLDRKMGYGRGDAAADAVRRDNPVDDDRGGDRHDDRSNNNRREPMRSVAPSRGNGSGGSSNSVHLTEGEVEAATKGTVTWNVGQTDHRGVRITKDDPRVGEPIGTYEYARRKKAMDHEGRYATPYAS